MAAPLPPPAAVRAAASQLLHAAAAGVPVPPVRDILGAGYTAESALAAGYAVQQLLTEHRLASGRRALGRKIGLTAPAVRAQLGVDAPDVGVLFDDMACAAGQPIAMSRLLQPRIEAEIAIVLAAGLDQDTSPEAVRAAVGYVVAAFEIVDSRIAGWDITLLDTVADNASSGLYVLGRNQVPLGDLDLRAVRMTMRDGSGAQVSAGTGADCLGDPLLALAWLARTVRELGQPLRAGEVILSGALGPMVAVTPGARFTADFGGLGSVHAVFGPPAAPPVTGLPAALAKEGHG